MRQFKLHNAAGEEYDLNKTGSFFHEPSGLGFEWDVKYETVGHQYMEESRKLKQKMPSGKITFAGYEEYEKFTKFIQWKPLTLEYTAAGTYYLNVEVESLEKTELQTGGLESGIKFIALGQIHKKITERINTQQVSGKSYNYRYPYTYKDNTSGQVQIVSDSVMESPVILTFLGPCKNPTWIHHVNDRIIASGKVYCDIPYNHRLIISTNGDEKIIETDQFGIEIKDRYQDSDFSTERFIMLEHGTNVLSFSHEGNTVLQVIAEGMICYESI